MVYVCFTSYFNFDLFWWTKSLRRLVSKPFFHVSGLRRHYEGDEASNTRAFASLVKSLSSFDLRLNLNGRGACLADG